MAEFSRPASNPDEEGRKEGLKVLHRSCERNQTDSIWIDRFFALTLVRAAREEDHFNLLCHMEADSSLSRLWILTQDLP